MRVQVRVGVVWGEGPKDGAGGRGECMAGGIRDDWEYLAA